MDAIVDWATPKNKELLSFLGFIQNYRWFIYNFSEKAAVLMGIRKGKKEFHWTEECQQVFNRLKTESLSHPTLHYPDDFSKHFTIYTDASEWGIRVVLVQQDESGGWAVAYANRTLSDSEQKLHINEKEMLAVYWKITNAFRPYIFGHIFDLVTDSSAVTALKK